MLRRRLDPELHGSSGHTSLLRLGAIGMVAAFFVIGSHLTTQAWYAGRILPGVTVAGTNLSGLTIAEARTRLAAKAASYHIRVSVGNEQFLASANDLGVAYDPLTTAEN